MSSALSQFYLLCMVLTCSLTLFLWLKSNRSMVIRGLTVIGLLNLITAILWGGSITCTLFALVLAMVGSYEVVSHRWAGFSRGGWVALVALMTFVMGKYFLGQNLGDQYASAESVSKLGFFIWALVLVATFALPAVVVASQLWLLLFAAIIVGGGCAALIALTQSSSADFTSIHWIAIILLVQFNDTLALLAGKRFGKHKLFPNLSPNKSIEGFAAGGVGVVLALVAISIILPVLEGFSLIETAALAVLLWLVINAGDLLFSKFKRAQSIKDFSAFLPGHGGILDRFDSLLVIAPVWWLIFG